MSTNILMTMLRPENVLMKADDMLLPLGRIPLGKEKDVESLIQELTKPVIEKACQKKPSDFYKQDVTVNSPEYQIRGKVKAFTRNILQEQSAKIRDFSAGQVDEEILEQVSEIICSTIAILCADYFSQQYTDESSKSLKKHIEPSYL
jgi:hypothetical protein